jgi:hypothetical protein
VVAFTTLAFRILRAHVSCDMLSTQYRLPGSEYPVYTKAVRSLLYLWTITRLFHSKNSRAAFCKTKEINNILMQIESVEDHAHRLNRN